MGEPSHRLDDSKDIHAVDVDYASLACADSRRAYFQRNGYVVRPGLLDEGICAEAMHRFEREIKPYKGPLYRQASANPERHAFDAAGNILNSLLNPLSVDGRRFPGFRSVTEALLCTEKLFAAIQELYQGPAVLVQSMYFEGNPATWPHQDSYYLDADTPGLLTGAWIALEDIDERAGRFYVLPGSQNANAGSNAGELSIGRHHDRYKQRIRDYVEGRHAEIRAPALKRGDVLLWGSRTVHGATRPADPSYTRHSYTAHFIPATARFMQYECIPQNLHPETFRGNRVCRPKDQNRLQNRLMLTLESLTPALFPRLKRAVIAHRIRRATENQSG